MTDKKGQDGAMTGENEGFGGIRLAKAIYRLRKTVAGLYGRFATKHQFIRVSKEVGNGRFKLNLTFKIRHTVPIMLLQTWDLLAWQLKLCGQNGTSGNGLRLLAGENAMWMIWLKFMGELVGGGTAV